MRKKKTKKGKNNTRIATFFVTQTGGVAVHVCVCACARGRVYDYVYTSVCTRARVYASRAGNEAKGFIKNFEALRARNARAREKNIENVLSKSRP